MATETATKVTGITTLTGGENLGSPKASRKKELLAEKAWKCRFSAVFMLEFS
jgi:hypothetical protein